MFCTTECWSCEDKTCEHYIDKTKLYFENEKNKEEIEQLIKECIGMKDEIKDLCNKLSKSNNMIDELEKLFKEQLEDGRSKNNTWLMGYYDASKDYLDKLKELKEGK